MGSSVLPYLCFFYLFYVVEVSFIDDKYKLLDNAVTRMKKKIASGIMLTLISVSMLILVLPASGQTELWKYKTDDAVSCVSISADGNYVVAGTKTSTYEGDAFFLDSSGTLLWSKHFDEEIQGVSVSGDGSAVIITIDEFRIGYPDTFLYDKNGNLVWQKDLVSGSGAIDIAISDDGNYIVTGDTDNKVYLFDKNGNELWTYTLGDWATAVDLSFDAEYVVAGSWDKCVYLFDRSGTLLWDFKLPYDISYKSVSISNDSSYISAGYHSFQENVVLIDINGNSVWNIRTGRYTVYGISITAEGGFIAVGSGEFIYLLGKNGETLWTHEAGNYINEVSVTPDGTKVVAGSEDTYVYYLLSGHIIREFPTWTAMLFALTIVTVVIVIYKRRLLKTSIH